MEKMISVIIPIYNCAEYLEKCLDSVLSQSIQKKEIICVDDGSTDRSLEILKKYAVISDGINVISQENAGAGVARNNGMKHAKGKYIAFLDGDDYYLEADALETMVKACEEYKVSICGSLRKECNKVGEIETGDFLQMFEPTIKDSVKVCKYHEFQMDYDYQSYIFERKLLSDNSIIFPTYRRFQDPPFFVKAMDKADTFVVVNKYLYCYRQPAFFSRFNMEKTFDLLCGLKDNLEYGLVHHLDKLLERTIERINYEYCDVAIWYGDDNEKILNILEEINNIFKQDGKSITSIRPLLRLENEIYAGYGYENWLLNNINMFSKVAIFGAGNYGKKFLDYLINQKLGDRVKCFLVSDTRGNNNMINDIPVVSIENCNDELMLVLVALNGSVQKEVDGLILKKGYKEVIYLNNIFLDNL